MMTKRSRKLQISIAIEILPNHTNIACNKKLRFEASTIQNEIINMMKKHIDYPYKKSEMVSKIAPHLKTGLSIRKSVLEAKISRATFYRYMQNDKEFREQITHFCNFNTVLLHNALFQQLITIVTRQNGQPEKGIPPQMLEKEDVRFLQWYALKHKQCREEFGNRNRTNAIDANTEIYKLNTIITVKN